MLLEPANIACPDLFCQSAHDLDPGQIALMHCPIKCLPSEGLLMNCSVRVPIKKTAQLVFQLMDSGDRGIDQGPG